MILTFCCTYTSITVTIKWVHVSVCTQWRMAVTPYCTLRAKFHVLQYKQYTTNDILYSTVNSKNHNTSSKPYVWWWTFIYVWAVRNQLWRWFYSREIIFCARSVACIEAKTPIMITLFDIIGNVSSPPVFHFSKTFYDSPTSHIEGILTGFDLRGRSAKSIEERENSSSQKFTPNLTLFQASHSCYGWPGAPTRACIFSDLYGWQVVRLGWQGGR